MLQTGQFIVMRRFDGSSMGLSGSLLQLERKDGVVLKSEGGQPSELEITRSQTCLEQQS